MARRKAEEPDREGCDLERAPSALAGKKADEPAIVRWVARNIDEPAPDPRECPDPFAWTLLRQCRSSPEFTAFFVEKLWAKLIPARSQIDAGSAKVFDGKPTLELINKILVMRGAAEAPPAGKVEIPDAFETFDPEEDP